MLLEPPGKSRQVLRRELREHHGNEVKLYKYMHSRYVNDMRKRGRIYIGTASDFRRVDGTVGGRSDPLDIAQDWRPAGGEYIHKSGIKWVFAEQGGLRFFADALLFCCSHTYSEAQRVRMASEFGHDTVVEIENSELLFRAISRHPRLLRRKGMHDFVTYDKVLRNADNILPQLLKAFSKLPDFRWQAEYRFVWIPGQDFFGRTIEKAGFTIDIPEIIPLLSFH